VLILMRTRRGFTLIELLISLVLLGMVTGSIFMLLNTTQRVSRAQSERTSLQSNVRTGAIVVPAELRQINTVVGGTVAQNDILGNALSSTSINYRAMRGFGTICQAPTSTEIRVLGSSWSAYRDPQAVRDSVYVFIENNSDRSTDDVWQPARISAVASGNVCPGGVAGYTLTINPAVAALASSSIGAPVRTYEVMTLSLYVSGGESWLGAQSNSAGEAMQPMLGPLQAGNGLAFEYFNAAGATTTDPKQVKSVRVTLRGVSDQKVVNGAGSRLVDATDSLVSQVVLRNALR
jgi:prepilin-type N-terminal cleavage/methylation domain-containing protein